MLNLKLQYFPNNEFRLTVYRPPFRKTEDPYLDISPELETATKTLGSRRCDPTEKVSRDTKKPGFGLTPRPTAFGLNGRRSLMRAGGALDKTISDPSELLFLTGTLPGSTPEAYQAMADWSGYAVHRLKAWIAKRVQSKLDFYVWELQKRCALHLHYCVHVADNSIAKFVLSQFKSEWNRILESICELSGVDVFARLTGGSWRDYKDVTQAYAQRVKKSVASYLAKYCSKGARGQVVHSYYPSRWWSMSRPLKQLVEDMTETYTQECIGDRMAGGMVRRAVDMLEVRTERLSHYTDKFGRAWVWVAYSTSLTFKELICQMKQEITRLEQSKSLLIPGLSLGESMILRLKLAATFLRLSPFEMSKKYSPSAANSLSAFLADQNLNYWRALELAQAIEYLLWNSSLTLGNRPDYNQYLRSMSLIASFCRSRLRETNGLIGEEMLKSAV